MLLVPTGAFWIARPLGLSKEWNVESSFTPDMFLAPTFCVVSELVLLLNCSGLRIGEADRSLPDEGFDGAVSTRANVGLCAFALVLFSEDRCQERVFAEG